MWTPNIRWRKRAKLNNQIASSWAKCLKKWLLHSNLLSGLCVCVWWACVESLVYMQRCSLLTDCSQNTFIVKMFKTPQICRCWPKHDVSRGHPYVPDVHCMHISISLPVFLFVVLGILPIHTIIIFLLLLFVWFVRCLYFKDKLCNLQESKWSKCPESNRDFDKWLQWSDSKVNKRSNISK